MNEPAGMSWKRPLNRSIRCPERNLLLGLAELGAGAHDRDQAAVLAQELERVDHIVDVSLPVERRVHDDQVIEVSGLRRERQEVLLHDTVIDAFLTQTLSQVVLDLDAVDQVIEAIFPAIALAESFVLILKPEETAAGELAGAGRRL